MSCLISVAIKLIVEHISEYLSNKTAFMLQKRLLLAQAQMSDCVFWETAVPRQKLQRLH